MSNQNWREFIQVTKIRRPVGFLTEAVKISGPHKGKALDLGCGAGVDVKYLAENGYDVEAVDINDNAIEQTKNTCKDLPVEVIHRNISDFGIAPNFYNLIICWNALPFLSKKEAKKVLLDIQKGLVKNGIFVFSLFGQEDEWAQTHPEMSFWIIEELKKTLPKMDFIKILEEKQKRAGAVGELKFWHLIQGIARRK